VLYLLLLLLAKSNYTGVPEIRDSIHDTEMLKASSNKQIFGRKGQCSLVYNSATEVKN